MKKSINLWAFPYPGRMSLSDCLKLAKDAGFDGIELNYDLENDLSPKSDAARFRAIRKMADDTGHRDQRPLFIPVLAVFTDRQRSLEAGAGHGAGPAHDRSRP